MQTSEFTSRRHGTATTVTRKAAMPPAGVTSSCPSCEVPSREVSIVHTGQPRVDRVFTNCEIEEATDALAARADPHYGELMRQYTEVTRKLEFHRRNGATIKRAMARSPEATEDWADQFHANRTSEQRLRLHQTELVRQMDEIRNRLRPEAIWVLERNSRCPAMKSVRVHGDVWVGIIDEWSLFVILVPSFDNSLNYPPQRLSQMIMQLPIPIPFSKKDWSKMTLHAIGDDKRLQKYYLKCAAAIHAGDRASAYGMQFMRWASPEWTGAGHWMKVGASFITNLEPELDQIRHQQFTKQMLEQALTRVITMDIGVIFPNGAVCFEFQIIDGDIAGFMARRIGAAAELKEALEVLATVALGIFVVQINIELGNAPASSWKATAVDR